MAMVMVLEWGILFMLVVETLILHILFLITKIMPLQLGKQAQPRRLVL